LSLGFFGAAMASIYSLVSVTKTGMLFLLETILSYSIFLLFSEKPFDSYSFWFSLVIASRAAERMLGQRIYLFSFMGYRIGLRSNSFRETFLLTHYYCLERLKFDSVLIDSLEVFSLL